jgi:hypothetical protein
MKNMIASFFLPLILAPTLAFAAITEDAQEIRIAFKGTADAQKLYNRLAVPITFGDAFTGKKHQYKFFQDANKSLTLYGVQEDKNTANCIFVLSKNTLGNQSSVDDSSLGVHLILWAPLDVTRLMAALDVPVLVHGDFNQKVLSSEEENFSISCIQKQSALEKIQCDIWIFR